MRRLALLAALLASPAHADWAFRVDWGPLPLAEGVIRLDRTTDTTRFAANVSSIGAGALFSDFAIEGRATYLPDGSRTLRLSVESDGETDLRALDWTAAGLPVVLATGDEDDDDGPLTPIPEGETLGTVDPFAPILGTLARLDAGQDCAATWRVYDGTRRYDVTLSDLGPDTLEADRDWTFAGPARKCRMIFRRIGGFQVNRPPRAPESDFTRHVWFAPIDAGRHIPVRFRAEWSLGYATARIALK